MSDTVFSYEHRLLLYDIKERGLSMRQRNRKNCGCGRSKTIVHPTQQNVVHCCSEETIKQIHPSHTTVMNHHLVKNVHEFPHSTSTQNTFSEENVYGGSFNVPNQPSGVMGSMSPGMNMGPGQQGMMGPNNQVGGAMNQGQQQGMGQHCHPNKGMQKPNKWC